MIEDKEQKGHREGKVVKILSRNKDTLVGVFTKNQNFGAVFAKNLIVLQKQISQ